MEIEKKRYYFGFRFEKAIAERINRHCKGAGISLNRLVGKAFDFAASAACGAIGIEPIRAVQGGNRGAISSVKSRCRLQAAERRRGS